MPLPYEPSGAITKKHGQLGSGRIRGIKPNKIPPPPPFHQRGEGLIIVFSKIPGLTPDGVLDHPFVFQCPPLNDFSPGFSWSFDDYATVDSGLHTNPQYRNLTTISFDTLVVDARHPSPTKVDPNYPFVVAHVADPQSVVRKLKRLGESMRPFQIQAGQPRLWGVWEPLGPGDQAALAVTLRSLSPSERALEPDARYLSLSLVEFRDAPALSVTQPPKLIGGTGHIQTPHTDAATGTRILRVYDPLTLPPGKQTLYQLAKDMYGSAAAWRLISRASGLGNIPPSANLKDVLGKRHPVPKIIVPARQKTPAPAKKKTR